MLFLLWILHLGYRSCSVQYMNQDGTTSNRIMRGSSSNDMVSKIAIGETQSFNFKKDMSFATPNVEDLIKEDEYLLKPTFKNKGYEEVSETEF